MIATPSHLTSTCGNAHCKSCAEPVRQADTGRWFITMGHPGFNSNTNNRQGYATKEKAIQAFRLFAGK